MEKAYKFRLYPNKEQEILIQKTFGCVRYVYNYFLAERKRRYEENKEVMNYYSCNRELTIIKHTLGMEWLREPDKNALQYALRDLDVAYKNFFHGVKNGKNVGYPKFKNKHDRNKSYRTPYNGSNLEILKGCVKLPKLGKVKCRISQEVKGKISNAVVIQAPSGKYFISFSCVNVEIKPYEKTGVSIGLDVGLKELVTASSGEKYENKKYSIKAAQRLARLQRRLSRKPKDSKRRERARIAVAKLYERITNQRNDYLQKLSTKLVKENDIIALESLSVKNMVNNHRLARSINDAAWSTFVRQLEYKGKWRGKTIVKIDRFYPSSQFCSSCGYKNDEVKKLSIRKWICPRCGAEHDRDVNAAKNILKEGLKLCG